MISGIKVKVSVIITHCFEENKDKHTITRNLGNHALSVQPTD